MTREGVFQTDPTKFQTFFPPPFHKSGLPTLHNSIFILARNEQTADAWCRNLARKETVEKCGWIVGWLLNRLPGILRGLKISQQLFQLLVCVSYRIAFFFFDGLSSLLLGCLFAN